MTKSIVDLEDLRRFKSGLEELQKACAGLAKQANSTAAEDEIGTKVSELESLKSELQSTSSSLSQKASRLQSELSSLRAELAATPPYITVTETHTDSEGNTYETSHQESNPAYAALEAQISSVSSRLDQVRSALSKVDDSIRSVSDTVEKLKDFILRINRYSSAINKTCMKVSSRVDSASPRLQRAISAVQEYSWTHLNTDNHLAPSAPTYSSSGMSGSPYHSSGSTSGGSYPRGMSASSLMGDSSSGSASEQASDPSPALPPWWGLGAGAVWLALSASGYRVSEQDLIDFIGSHGSCRPQSLGDSAEARMELMNGCVGSSVCSVEKASVNVVVTACKEGKTVLVPTERPIGTGCRLALVTKVGTDTLGNPVRFDVSVYDSGLHRGTGSSMDLSEFNSALGSGKINIIKKH